MCCSMVMVVVSLRDVRDDGGELGGERQVKARDHDRRSRRAEDPILSERSKTKWRENCRGRAALSWLLPSGMIGRSEQTGFALVWHNFASARLVQRQPD
ncbi:hypothetical protein PMI09_01974 [Rhizobium sp. CF122]|nr:hypothetical protein PMI09_01974 [Rhizobium sp. CF122]